MTDTSLGARLRIPGWKNAGPAGPPQLIELTEKRWKSLMVIAFAGGWIGLAFIAWQVWSGIYKPLIETGFGATAEFGGLAAKAFNGPAGVIGWTIFALAVALGVYARFMAWWRHG